MPDEPLHPEPKLILDYRGRDDTANVGSAKNRSARTAGGLAIATVAILALMCAVLYLEGNHPGPMSPLLIVCFFLGIPSFLLTGIAALVLGIAGLGNCRHPNTRGLVPSILGIAAGLLVVALLALLCYWISVASQQ